MKVRPALQRFAPLVLAVLVAGLVGTAPGTAAPAATEQPDSVGIRLVEIPAAAKDDPRARAYIVDHLAPGTTIEREIEVSNTAAVATQVDLYAAAASIRAGSFLGAEDRSANDLSSWTSVTPASKEVNANGVSSAVVTIAVPADAAPGEHYAVVWAEVRTPSEDGVLLVNRVGIRIYLSVGPGGAPAADFEIRSLTASRSPEGQPVVIATVQNTGGRALDMSGVLDLANGPGGLNAGPFDVRLGTTLGIGETEPVTVILDTQIPAGPWDATITLTSGLLELSASASITFPDSGAAAPVDATADQPWLLYLALAAFILFVLAIAIAVLVARRRRSVLAAA